jgi:cystathionine gamma-synthase
MAARDEMSLDSWVVAGGRPDVAGAPLNEPIVPASTYVRGGEFTYSRDEGTPSVAALEALIGGMEGGSAVSFSSGMAAVAAVFDTLEVGSRIVIPDDCYQGVAGLAADGVERGRWTVARVALADTAGWVDAVGSADLIWLESPSNPLLGVADLAAICSAPRRTGNLIAVDNTFATPFNQRPLEFGADVSMHSVTKFIGGHSDLLAGALVVDDPELEAVLRRSRVLTGALPGALEAYLALRGARTMAVRLERSQTTAGVLAERLAAHAAVSVIRYPGLAADPNHEVASRVLDGYGAMISFDVSGTADDADAALARLRLITHATSLGGVESTIERRAIIPGQEHLPQTLLRLSVGCESVNDLWNDLDQALSG